MNGLQTIIVLGAGASYSYGIPIQSDIIGRLFAKYDVTNGEGFPTFIGTFGMKHSFPLGQFLRKYFNLPENPAKENAKLDFWPTLQQKGYTLESLYALLESVLQDESRYLLEDFEAIVRTAVTEPTGERTFDGTCEHHRILIESLEPGDSIINFNWDTLAADALLYYSYFWFPATGFGVPVYPLLRNVTQKRYNIDSFVRLFQLHGSIVLFELVEPTENTRMPRFIYLGPQTQNIIGSFWNFIEQNKDENLSDDTTLYAKRDPTVEEVNRLNHGWLYWSDHWYCPIFLPPSKFKKEYSSPYVHMIKANIYNRLISAQQIVLAGYSLPPADVDHLSAIFVPQIINQHAKLKVINYDNDKKEFRERIESCFRGISDIDYSEHDFKEFCKQLNK